MLQTQLLELLNSGEAWAFVGSGPSVDAHAPTWRSLVERAAALPGCAEVAVDPAFVAACAARNIPLAFDYIEAAVGRQALVALVEGAFTPDLQPGPMHQVLARLPFRGYITTNYDTLLEDALVALGEPWIAVGNRADENRKITGGAKELVWHVHGAVRQDDKRSRLVLTQRDYDDTYRAGSELLEQLKALLLQRRLVFVGCGFDDFDMTSLLRNLGGLLDAGRPAFAFMEKQGGGVSHFR